VEAWEANVIFIEKKIKTLCFHTFKWCSEENDCT